MTFLLLLSDVLLRNLVSDGRMKAFKLQLKVLETRLHQRMHVILLFRLLEDFLEF